jgi:hypothetical protein
MQHEIIVVNKCLDDMAKNDKKDQKEFSIVKVAFSVHQVFSFLEDHLYLPVSVKS